MFPRLLVKTEGLDSPGQQGTTGPLGAQSWGQGSPTYRCALRFNSARSIMGCRALWSDLSLALNCGWG